MLFLFKYRIRMTDDNAEIGITKHIFNMNCPTSLKSNISRLNNCLRLSIVLFAHDFEQNSLRGRCAMINFRIVAIYSEWESQPIEWIWKYDRCLNSSHLSDSVAIPSFPFLRTSISSEFNYRIHSPFAHVDIIEIIDFHSSFVHLKRITFIFISKFIKLSINGGGSDIEVKFYFDRCGV